MRNFMRGLRSTCPYRGRLIASIICALFAAVLWSLNLTAILPVLKLLGSEKSWAEQLDQEIEKFQRDYAAERAILDNLQAQLRAAEQEPEGRGRDDNERKFAGKVSQKES